MQVVFVPLSPRTVRRTVGVRSTHHHQPTTQGSSLKSDSTNETLRCRIKKHDDEQSLAHQLLDDYVLTGDDIFVRLRKPESKARSANRRRICRSLCKQIAPVFSSVCDVRRR